MHHKKHTSLEAQYCAVCLRLGKSSYNAKHDPNKIMEFYACKRCVTEPDEDGITYPLVCTLNEEITARLSVKRRKELTERQKKSYVKNWPKLIQLS